MSFATFPQAIVVMARTAPPNSEGPGDEFALAGLPAGDSQQTPDLRGAWWFLMGFLAMYVPTYVDLVRFFWWRDVGSHGPIILAATLVLLWRQRRDLLPVAGDLPAPRAGTVLVCLGLLAYIVGRSQQLFVLEVGSQIPLLLGVLLLLRGVAGLRRLWFPVCFLIFLVPWPGSLLDAVLMPLKQGVSVVVDDLLYAANYPVARNGVVLTVGPYQLFIANACAGLNSMIALTAVGLLFVYLARDQAKWHRWTLVLSILPIAFVANVLRVLILVLVTYHFGDAAGAQLHDIAGYGEIVFAFGAFFLLDALLLHSAARRDGLEQWKWR